MAHGSRRLRSMEKRVEGSLAALERTRIRFPSYSIPYVRRFALNS